MASLIINRFQGLVPRAGDQVLTEELATVAKNANLVSGELRPLLAALSVHKFEKIPPSTAEDRSEPTVVIPTTTEDTCVPVRIEQYPVRISRTAAGEDARNPPSFTVGLASGYTAPVKFEWYVNGTLYPGATSETFVFPKSAYGNKNFGSSLIFSVFNTNISVIITNPCGRVRANTAFVLT